MNGAIMLSAAFGQIADAFSAAYGGPFHSALAKHPGTPVLDSGGSIEFPGVATERPCKVQVDSVTDTMKRDANYQDKDVRLFVLAASLVGDIGSDHTISIIEGPHIGDWMIATVNRDPVAVGYECLGRQL